MPLRERATAETGTGEVHQIGNDTQKVLEERRRDAAGQRHGRAVVTSGGHAAPASTTAAAPAAPPTSVTPPTRARRDELVTSHLALAHSLARQFADRGEPLDDLRQVAAFGLVKAADRFDPERGVQFSTFATATVVGELKRH